MSRFLTTIPSNTGFVNLGLVETYPTGGGGPTAYGPTSYFGSDPLPATSGDNLNNPIDLGDFSSIFKSFVIKNTHGGLTRKQTTFYKIKLTKPRTIVLRNLNRRAHEEELLYTCAKKDYLYYQQTLSEDDKFVSTVQSIHH